MDDPVPPEVRLAESEIDTAYKTNALIGLPFSMSAWHVLGACEDRIFLSEVYDSPSPEDFNAIVNNLKFALKNALLWLRFTCPPGTAIPSEHNWERYGAAHSLLDTAHQYDAFVSAMTLASNGFTHLSVNGTTIVATYDVSSEARLEAYDTLVRRARAEENRSLFQEDPGIGWRKAIANSVRVRGERFTFRGTPRTVRLAMEWLSNTKLCSFDLPMSWHFGRYSISHYRDFFVCLSALAIMQIAARHDAARSGCASLGLADCLIKIERQDLVSRAKRYTGLAEELILEIIEDLTFGSRGQVKPDPALQPLIPLSKDIVAIAPHIVVSSSGERNLIALLNRIPAERRRYMQLVMEKESLMRDRMQESLDGKSLRCCHGRVPSNDDLPDIDLAIMDDVSKSCLLCELKWFVEPGDTREAIERSEDLLKGVAQCLKLRAGIHARNKDITDFLKIDSSWLVRTAVVSANWIGSAHVQHPDIPIINEFHLLQKIKACSSLLPVLDWLEARGFLPAENVDFKVVSQLSTVGRWSIEWYGVSIINSGSSIAV